MRCFPQLATGALGQYPLHRARKTRTVSNTLGDGSSIRLADADAQETEWQLRFKELTDGELEVLEQFFTAAEGRLNTFTFLDPVGNLLSWSEQLDEGAWEKDPLITLDGAGVDGPGTGRAWRVANGGTAPQAIGQTINVPAWYYYCLSVYARSQSKTEVTLFCGDQRAVSGAGPNWSRLILAAQSASLGETVRFGVELGGGAAVELFGLQVEAQTGASAYRRTLGQGGVYPGARLGENELKATTLGPGRHACALSVIHGKHF
jgi:hypothetical protein